MAPWNRINQSRLKFLSNQFKSYYFQLPYASSLDFIPISSKPSLLHNPCGFHKTSQFSHNIRFFASLHQANSVNGPRLNHQIEARYIRLVTDEGHEVVSTSEALGRARSLRLDLVEVQRNGDPPVCKIMDFNKEKYKQKVKEKDRAKSKSDVTLKKGECKEIRFSGKTEHKDLKMKADMVKKLMERGYRVKCVALGQQKRVSCKPFPNQVSSDDESTEGIGDDEATLERKEQEELERELTGVLSQLTTLIEDVAVVESGPRMAKRQAFVIVKHAKFGQSKKGKAKKSNNVQTTQATTKASGALEDDATETGDESEGQLSGDENDLPDEYHNTGRTPLSADSTNGTKTASINFVKNDAELEAGRRNFNPSNLSHLRPVHDSKQADKVPLSTQKPSNEQENRYRRVEPKPGFSQIPRDSRTSDGKDPFSYDQRFSTERAQPRPWTNVCPSIGERRNLGNHYSALRNTNLQSNDVRKPEVERPSPNYGIFSAQNRSSPSSTEGTRGNPNSPGSQVDNGQRKWGVFSRDSPQGASKPN